MMADISEIVPNTNGSISHYFATAIPLTLATIWIIIAFQSKRYLGRDTASLWSQPGWPIMVIRKCFRPRRSPPVDSVSEAMNISQPMAHESVFSGPSFLILYVSQQRAICTHSAAICDPRCDMRYATVITSNRSTQTNTLDDL